MNEYYKIVGLTVICFILGSMFWQDFFELSRNEIKSSKLILSSQGMGSYSSRNTLFSITIALIPSLHFGVVKFSKIRSFFQKLLSLAIILLSGSAFWQGKLLFVILKSQRASSQLEAFDSDIYSEYFISELQPELFLAIGLLVGAVVCITIFRKINLKKVTN